MKTETKFLPIKEMEKLRGLLIDINPHDLKKCVGEINEILQQAQTIHKTANTKAQQIWRRVKSKA